MSHNKCLPNQTETVTAWPGLTKAFAALAFGDSLVVSKLDRLDRSPFYLVSLIAETGARGVSSQYPSDPIDTTSAGGCLVMHIVEAAAGIKHSVVVKLTQARLQDPNISGRKLGRPPHRRSTFNPLCRADFHSIAVVTPMRKR